jgi:3-phosphoshikimate 1-carboxyvinyltransferase
MKTLTITPATHLRGQCRIPGDKSISHRALLFNAIANGEAQISNFLPGEDCQATLGCLRDLGVRVEQLDATHLTVHGRGLRGLQPAAAALNCIRSGTTMRLLMGLLAAMPFDTILSGDDQLLRRPMERVAVPLRQLGACVETSEGRAPVRIQGSALHGGQIEISVASAQIKSALLLAGLQAQSPVTVIEPGPSRDHTERMLLAMGARVEQHGLRATIHPVSRLQSLSLEVPGDLSSAAFLLAAGLLTPNSEINLLDVGINPTRTGLLDVTRAMGAKIAIQQPRLEGGEPLANIHVSSSPLTAVEVSGETVVRMIDEFPIFAVLATQAQGITIVRDAAELRVKETDRIATTAEELNRLGADVTPTPDGFIIQGPTPLRGGQADSHGDHRLAMALTIAGLAASEPLTVQNTQCIGDSFPGFEDLLRGIGATCD